MSHYLPFQILTFKMKTKKKITAAFFTIFQLSSVLYLTCLFSLTHILLMANLAFMSKLLPGQELHLHTILEPNWANSEDPLNDMLQYIIWQEKKGRTSTELVSFESDGDNLL